MGQSAGELFINLGLKGADKTTGELKNVSSGFSDIKAMSIEAKAAILAALAVLEKIVSTSGQLGTTLTNFGAISGVPIGALQRYEYQGNKVKVSNEEMISSFLNLQKAMFQVNAGGKLPEFLIPIITAVAQRGGISTKDAVDSWRDNPQLAFDAIQKYALFKDIPVAIRTNALEGAGFSPGLVTGLIEGLFTKEKLAQVPGLAILSEKDAKRLSGVTDFRAQAGNILFGAFNKGLLKAVDAYKFLSADETDGPSYKKLLSRGSHHHHHVETRTPVSATATVTVIDANGKKTTKSTHKQNYDHDAAASHSLQGGN